MKCSVHAEVQRDLDRLKHWVMVNGMNGNRLSREVIDAPSLLEVKRHLGNALSNVL